MAAEEAVCAADAAAVVGTGGEATATTTTVKLVELPVEYLKWVLAQRKEDYRVPTLDDYSPEKVGEEEEAICRFITSLQAAYDEFPELMAFVGDALEMNGCVMVPEGKLIPNFRRLQGRVDEEWAGAKQELADVAPSCVAGSDAGDEDETEVAPPPSSDKTTVPPLGPHLYTLSTYLSLIYGYVSHVVG
ncbi:hypothetical protein ACP70R_008190 [Stipagrostis hirtigluma subsp. patula]